MDSVAIKHRAVPMWCRHRARDVDSRSDRTVRLARQYQSWVLFGRSLDGWTFGWASNDCGCHPDHLHAELRIGLGFYCDSSERPQVGWTRLYDDAMLLMTSMY